MKTIEEYLERRAWLSNEASQFQCPDSCPRYGCKDPELHVSVTLMDLVLQSVTLRARPSDIYGRFYKIGWSPENEVPWVGHFTMELRKPCGFLKGEWCGIYPARPIACAQFPEAWYVSCSEDALITNRSRFHDYPCLKNPPPISKKRKKLLATLSEMAAQERWLSDFYLFGYSPLCVDLRNLVEEMLEIAACQGISPDRIDPDMPHMIPFAVVEGLFQRKLRQAGITERIFEKVACLDSPQRRASFFELKAVTDEIKKSFGLDDLSIYHRFEGNTLQSCETVRRKPFHRETTKVSIQGKDNGREREEKRT